MVDVSGRITLEDFWRPAASHVGRRRQVEPRVSHAEDPGPLGLGEHA